MATNTKKPLIAFGFKKSLVWLGIIIVVTVVATLAFSVNSMRKYNQLQEALASNKYVIESAGGYEVTPVHTNGGPWWFNNFLCIDVSCPGAQQSLAVPVDPGKEGEFLTQTLLESRGYNVSDDYCRFEGQQPFCAIDGQKDSIHLQTSIEEADKFHHNLPDKDVSPKIWRSIIINAY